MRTHTPTHLYSRHDGSHEVGNDKVVPEVQKPRLQLVRGLMKGAPHEHPGSKVHHIGMELVDELV